MEIKGKRGRQKGNKGYAMCDYNQNGKYYIRVWFKDSYYKKNGNTVIGDWKSIGRYGLPETNDKLFEHLISVYGSVDEQVVLQHLKEDFERLEILREERERKEYMSLMKQLNLVLKEKNESLKSIPNDLKELKKLYKKICK